MKKPKKNINVNSSIKLVLVKTGTVDEFFSNVKNVMRTADRGEPIKQRCATLTFSKPTEMLHFLSVAKIKLINSIRHHPIPSPILPKRLNGTEHLFIVTLTNLKNLG